MAHLNGIPVRVEPVTGRAPAAATAAAVGAGDARARRRSLRTSR